MCSLCSKKFLKCVSWHVCVTCQYVSLKFIHFLSCIRFYYMNVPQLLLWPIIYGVLDCFFFYLLYTKLLWTFLHVSPVEYEEEYPQATANQSVVCRRTAGFTRYRITTAQGSAWRFWLGSIQACPGPPYQALPLQFTIRSAMEHCQEACFPTSKCNPHRCWGESAKQQNSKKNSTAAGAAGEVLDKRRRKKQ